MRIWVGVAALCRSSDGRSLLMVLQGQPEETPSWAVPGGSIEPGETPEQAAVRETKEETGLNARILRPYTVVDGIKACGAYRVHYFEVEVVGGELLTNDLDGLIYEVRWIPADRLDKLLLAHEDQKQILWSFMKRS